jgi:RNA polymerase sigma-70 factor (ECF subfamily)
MFETPGTLLERLSTNPDEGSWGRFVELYTPLLLSYVRRLGLRQPDDADFVQEVFMHLVNKLPAFVYDSKRSFRGWLRTVTHNLWRNRRRMPAELLPGAVDLDGVPAAQAEAFWEVDYRRHLVDQALAIMQGEFQPTSWKACWEVVVHGRSAEEVGSELGLSAGAVRVAKFRVLNRLRRELDGLLD